MGHGKLRMIDRLRKTRVYRPDANKRLPKRLNWEQIESRPSKEGRGVVKGTSKRVVVVKSPDPKVFEEAIFIVKEDFLGRNGKVDALKEAQKVANEYIRGAISVPHRRFRIPPLVYALIGAVLSAAAGILIYYL